MATLDITDDDIALLSARERRELIWRLSRAELPGFPNARALRAMRLRRLVPVIVAVVALIPWTVYLANTLPDRHVVRHWPVTWVGFDILLLLVFAATAVFGLLRRQAVVFGAFASGLLLVCDAWFDVTTAGAHGLAGAVAAAVFVELPMAALLMSGAFRVIRLMSSRQCLVDANAAVRPDLQADWLHGPGDERPVAPRADAPVRGAA